MSPALAIGLAIRGALRALLWALHFYAQNAWPLLGIAAVPAIARAALALRRRHQMIPAHADEVLEVAVAAWRGVLLLATAGLDLLPASPWWESIWPGAWTAQLSTRLNSMSGRGLEWIGLCAGVAVMVFVVAGILRLLTMPQLLRRAFSLTGARPQKVNARVEAIGIAVGNLITIPLTTLLMYAAVARAALCLRT